MLFISILVIFIFSLRLKEVYAIEAYINTIILH